MTLMFVIAVVVSIAIVGSLPKWQHSKDGAIILSAQSWSYWLL